MNRFALILILAAVSLFAAGMLAQSENVSDDGPPNNLSASSTRAKQFFRGYWTDGSNFTQDASYLSDEFSAVGIFNGAVDQTDSNCRHIASALSDSRRHFQAFEKQARLADSKTTSAQAQLAQFKALYASLTRGGRTYSGELSLSVYHQLMDQQFSAGKHAKAAARARYTFDAAASFDANPAGFPAAELEAVRMTAQHTEHDADIQAVLAARLKKTMLQRRYQQRPATPLRNHQSGEAAPAPAQQTPVVALATLHFADARQNTSGEFTELKNLQRKNHVEVSVSAGADNSSSETIGFQNAPGEWSWKIISQ